MCGIAGIIGESSSEERVRKMNQQMHHRGPDDHGTFSEPGAAIGMTRLSIIDTSNRGHQPMQSHCGRYWIVYNGECYNFLVIRKELEKEGVKFTSDSDTEVVLAAYVRYGSECLEMLNGMYAFAIWDTLEKSCFAARDRFGIKPFYYSLVKNSLIFGSEIKAMLASGLVDWNVNSEAVLQYFTFGHIIQPETILQPVKALMPGHYLTYKDNRLEVNKYWTLRKTDFKGSYEEGKEILLEKLGSAVKSQMVSDRPLGLFLSGGLDSATLLYMMKSQGFKTHTFSIGFEDSPFAKNESRDAAALANYFGATHLEVMLNGSMVKDELYNYFQACDQPTIDGLNTFFVSKYASKEMTVALNGLGADELFAGYSRHARAYWKNKNMGLERVLINKVAAGILPFSKHAAYVSFLLKVLYHSESKNARRNYVLSRVLNFPDKTEEIVSSPLRNLVSGASFMNRQMEHFDNSKADSFFEQSLHLELQGFMSSMILRDSDAISMFHSLEVRFPFIDHEVGELAYSFPAEFKIDTARREKVGAEGSASYRAMGTKKILMDAMEPHLPKGFADRPKNGFKVPLNFWLRRDLKELTQSILEDGNQEGWAYVDQDKARAIRTQFYNSEDNNFTLWSIISFLGNVNELKKIYVEHAGRS